MTTWEDIRDLLTHFLVLFCLAYEGNSLQLWTIDVDHAISDVVFTFRFHFFEAILTICTHAKERLLVVGIFPIGLSTYPSFLLAEQFASSSSAPDKYLSEMSSSMFDKGSLFIADGSYSVVGTLYLLTDPSGGRALSKSKCIYCLDYIHKVSPNLAHFTGSTYS